MRNFLYRMSSSLARFMYGRNGADQLNTALLALYLVIWLLEVLLARQALAAGILNMLSLLLAAVVIFRIFSKNLPRRRAENQRFLGWWLPLKGRLQGARQRRRDREHRYFTCKSCGAICRVPAGKGRIEITCPKCGGKGKIISSPCKSCGGGGNVRKQRKISVSIPQGINDKQAVSLRGQGNAGANNGPAGDLIVEVRVKPHPYFQREGTSVLYECPVSFYQAAMGAELEIPTIDGKVKYTLPAGTQPGTTFRLRGKGIPELRGRGRGDQYVTVQVRVPTSLTNQQRDALQAFAEAMGESAPSSGSPVKDFFSKKKKK